MFVAENPQPNQVTNDDGASMEVLTIKKLILLQFFM